MGLDPTVIPATRLGVTLQSQAQSEKGVGGRCSPGGCGIDAEDDGQSEKTSSSESAKSHVNRLCGSRGIAGLSGSAMVTCCRCRGPSSLSMVRNTVDTRVPRKPWQGPTVKAVKA